MHGLALGNTLLMTETKIVYIMGYLWEGSLDFKFT